MNHQGHNIGFPITAMSIVCGLGVGTEKVLSALYAGQRGLVESEGRWGVDTWVGEVPEELPALDEHIHKSLQGFDSRQSRLCQLLWADSLAESFGGALKRWGASRIGLIIGTSTAGIEASEQAWAHHQAEGSWPQSYSFERQHTLHATLDVLRTLTGARGPGLVVSTACSSGGKVFATALRMLRAGLIDAAIVGGVDSLCKLTIRGFNSLEVLSSEPCRPFSAERRGINIGEGGALFLLEKEGEGSRVLGVGESSDAFHMTAPHPEGQGALMAMEAALRDAGRTKDEIAFVNAHGTGTRQNDQAEGRAINRLFGEQMLVSSTKGYTGHALGAAGALEAAFCIAALQRRQIPGSVGCDPLDSEIAVRMSKQKIDLKEPTKNLALSNSLAFGGSNVSVCFEGAKA